MDENAKKPVRIAAEVPAGKLADNIYWLGVANQILAKSITEECDTGYNAAETAEAINAVQNAANGFLFSLTEAFNFDAKVD